MKVPPWISSSHHRHLPKVKVKGKWTIAVCKKPSPQWKLTTYGITVLPATRQRCHYHPYPSQLKLEECKAELT